MSTENKIEVIILFLASRAWHLHLLWHRSFCDEKYFFEDTASIMILDYCAAAVIVDRSFNYALSREILFA